MQFDFKTVSSNERNRTVDIARGIAIVCMIAGHAQIGIPKIDDWFSIWYHAWHMPIFFIISGMFYKEKKDFIYQKAYRILLPFVCWSFINFIWEVLDACANDCLSVVIISPFIDRPTDGVPGWGGGWFLPALFWTNTLYYIITKLLNNIKLSLPVIFLVGIIGMLAQGHGFLIPFGIGRGISFLPFMTCGVLIKMFLKNTLTYKRISALVIILMFFIVNWLIFYNGTVNFRRGQYNNIYLSIINAILYSIIIIYISNIIDKSRYTNLLGRVLSVIGRDSMIYLCFNQRAILIIKSVLESHILFGNMLWILICFFVTLGTVILVCYVLNEILSSNRVLKLLLGK